MRRFSIPTVLLLGTLIVALTGCSRNPVAPITAPVQGGAQTSGIQIDDVPSDVGGGQPSVVTAEILPDVQGQLQVGRFTLDLHKNTLKMPATITMRVASEDAMEVQIEISPAEANDFQVPADLTADMSDQADLDVSDMTVFEWEGGDWQEISETSRHANHGSLVSKVKHVRNCSVGHKKNGAETAKGLNR